MEKNFLEGTWTHISMVCKRLYSGYWAGTSRITNKILWIYHVALQFYDWKNWSCYKGDSSNKRHESISAWAIIMRPVRWRRIWPPMRKIESLRKSSRLYYEGNIRGNFDPNYWLYSLKNVEFQYWKYSSNLNYFYRIFGPAFSRCRSYSEPWTYLISMDQSGWYGAYKLTKMAEMRVTFSFYSHKYLSCHVKHNKTLTIRYTCIIFTSIWRRSQYTIPKIQKYPPIWRVFFMKILEISRHYSSIHAISEIIYPSGNHESHHKEWYHMTTMCEELTRLLNLFLHRCMGKRIRM